MLKKFIGLCLIAGITFGGLHAEGAYFGYGLGLQVNLADLGGTITKDGLDNSVGDQKIIVPENTIEVLQRSGLVSRDTNSAMSGLILSLFYEKENVNTFYRIGFDYTRKIMGGKTKAQIAGYTFIDQNWDFYSMVIPFYYGVKAGVSETSSVYGALGINYFRGGWKLYGTVDGATPCVIGLAGGSYSLCSLGPWGTSTARTTLATNKSNGISAQSTLLTLGQDVFYQGAILGEEIVFDVNGIGFNFMIGIDTKLQSGNKFYFEIEYLLDAKMDDAPVRSLGTINQLAPTGRIAYPIVIGGTRFKFGLKQPL